MRNEVGDGTSMKKMTKERRERENRLEHFRGDL